MDLTKILSISGKPGLFKIISQTRTSIIVESLTDGKRFPAYATQQISNLGEIAVYTTGEEIPLTDVLKKIYDKLGEDGNLPDSNADNDKLKAFFCEILPEYDKERVYVSDIRKIIMWYNILRQKNMIEFSENENVETEETEASTTEKTENK